MTERTAIPAMAPPRPMFRGTFHGVAALVAPFALVYLVLISRSPTAYVGAAIFASSLILLYGTSATYHLVRWGERHADIVERIDHSMIFVLIAGTYTPFCLCVVGWAWGIPLLAVIWSLAGAGILVQTLWPSAPRWISVGSYVLLGWTGLIAASQVVATLPLAPVALLVTGGVLYSVGALVYARRRPDPLPRTFGYHEVFHSLVIAGTLAHFSVIAMWVLPR